MIWKVSCSGNKFLVIERDLVLSANRQHISDLCTTHSADGLVKVAKSGDDWNVEFFNSDGSEFQMSFNGALSAAYVLYHEHQVFSATIKSAIGLFSFKILKEGIIMEFTKPSFQILECTDEKEAIPRKRFLVKGFDPHLIVFSEESPLSSQTFLTNASLLRCQFKTNVHWVYPEGDIYLIRHFEKGIERETKSCGSGCIAVALLLHTNRCLVFKSPGGECWIKKVDDQIWQYYNSTIAEKIS